MINLLLGNGIDIQFGGVACTSRYIIKRIKYKALQDGYDKLFGYELTSKELLAILDGFVFETNSIISGDYDVYAVDDDTIQALEDFKDRYTEAVNKPDDIMLEDWLFIVHMFFLKNIDLEENRVSAVQGFERLLLDAIYNDGLVQKIHTQMNRQVKKFLRQYDNIFTLNYDNNIEVLTGKKVYHLHGDFSVLADSENENCAIGYLRHRQGETVFQEEYSHCYCNALLNYSGRLKLRHIEECRRANDALERLYSECIADTEKLQRLKDVDAPAYEQVEAKIGRPELIACSDYYYREFATLEGELHIIGVSPNNDAHIFDAILGNDKIKKVVFYYSDPKHKDYIEATYSKELFVCEDVNVLWRKLNCNTPKLNCNYPFPDEIEDFVNAFNALSMDTITIDQVKENIKQITRSEMERLCKLVKTDMNVRNPEHKPTDVKNFIKQNASISYIALQQGVLPTVLYLICVMNFDLIKDREI